MSRVEDSFRIAHAATGASVPVRAFCANSVPFNNCVPLGVVAPERRLTAESVKVFPGCLVLRLINSFTIVASAMAPDSRSDDEDGAIPPQPFGPMGVAGDGKAIYETQHQQPAFI